MSKIVTFETFLQRAKSIHGDKYIYDKDSYRIMSEKIPIKCEKHGIFWQKPENHVLGNGCAKCNYENTGKRSRKTQEEFIQQSKDIFGNLYSYDNTKYIRDKNKVNITCLKHGEFLILPTNFLRGWGCTKCSREKQIKESFKEFIKKANEIHNFKYDYSKVNYEWNNKKIEIICPLHGSFWQIPRSHIKGCGCYECARLIFGKAVKSNTKDFIKKCKSIHGEKYNYDKVDYKDADTKVIIECPIHGEFLQSPRTHLSKCGCPKCNKYQGYSKSQWINYNKEKEGTFYIIKCWNEEEVFYKIGITRNTVKERYPYGGDLKYSWKLIKEIKSKNLEYIWDLEKRVKNELKNFKYKPKIKFAGSAVECFSLIKISYICNLQ